LLTRINCSVEQFSKIYHSDYIYYALRPLIRSNILDFKFISIQYLFPDPLDNDKDIWSQNIDNPFIKKYKEKQKAFGEEILSKGMYFPLCVYPIENKGCFYVYEGRHRVAALRFLMDDGELSPDYKVLCIISNDCV